jgi:hypothetical protein
MKKNKSELLTYFKLIILLIIPIALITAYSFSDKKIIVGDLELQKADIAPYFHPDHSPVDSLDTVVEPEEEPVICDTASQRILFFGDSMIEGLSRRMKQYASENHHELLNVIWYSSSTKIWAEHTDTLKHFMQEFQPTYIMICLGGNELFIKDLDKRDAYIKDILRTVAGTPYVWIGPPNWKADTGINQTIEKNVGTYRFFPSKRLNYQRKSDGAHPTYASAAMWMDSVAHWMNDSIRHRIVMKFPENQTKPSGKTTLLQPLK